jgi:hypothetical protein
MAPQPPILQKASEAAGYVKILTIVEMPTAKPSFQAQSVSHLTVVSISDPIAAKPSAVSARKLLRAAFFPPESGATLVG